MNVRKPVDYGTMYRELAAILARNLPQMDEIYAIGKAISQRPEKGAAVAAAEFLQANFLDRTGFSPRNVRRMRDFYKTYENDQTLLQLAMKIGWTLNVVIMESELEFFCEPGTDLEWFKYWRGFCRDWLISLGIKEEEMRLRDHDPAELAFYSKGTTDIEFLFPFGWGELWGIADRTDYDLGRHQEVSGQDLTYFDDQKNEKYLPYVIEPSLGADRVVLAFLCAAYDEEDIGTPEKPDVRTVFHFHPALAPVKIGVLPLSKKLNESAEKVFAQLSKTYNCEYDDRGTIGKRYRRQDEIGTPFCVTYDFDSEEDHCVTVRDRDTMEQERIAIDELDAYFAKKFEF